MGSRCIWVRNRDRGSEMERRTGPAQEGDRTSEVSLSLSAAGSLHLAVLSRGDSGLGTFGCHSWGVLEQR